MNSELSSVRAVLGALISLQLVGCSFLTPAAEPTLLYTLQREDCASQVSGSEGNKPVILVRTTDAPSIVDSSRILFSRNPGVMGAYQFATWSESPTRRITSLILEKLECGLPEVLPVRGTSTIEARFALSTELTDYYHDIRSEPGAVRIRMRAELIDLSSRTLVAAKVFDENIEAPEFNADGAVQAFTVGVHKLNSELLDWLKENIFQNSSPKA